MKTPPFHVERGLGLIVCIESLVLLLYSRQTVHILMRSNQRLNLATKVLYILQSISISVTLGDVQHPRNLCMSKDHLKMLLDLLELKRPRHRLLEHPVGATTHNAAVSGRWNSNLGVWNDRPEPRPE